MDVSVGNSPKEDRHLVPPGVNTWAKSWVADRVDLSQICHFSSTVLPELPRVSDGNTWVMC